MSDAKNVVVVYSSQFMGSGDDTLGATIMKAFTFQLTQQEVLPKTLLFYNGGAHLTCEGSALIDDLKTLEAAGVEILTCGTCLKYYGLEDKLAVGSASNMPTIVAKQLAADVVVKP